MKAPYALGIASLFVVAGAVAQIANANLSVSVNGKPVPGKTMVVKSETYVPLSALKAAGILATVKDGVLAITLPASGGANQVGALEGGLNDWLFNGIWRFRVTSVIPNDDGRPGWTLHVELRNGTKLDQMALAGSGFDSLSLVMADGNSVAPYNISDLRDKPVGQGALVAVDLVFYDDDGNGRKPEKLLLRLQPDQPTKDYLKTNGAVYSVADPSFRVKLSGG